MRRCVPINTWNAGQILSVVRTINRMDINYLGPDESTQDQTLLQFCNVALWSLARLCYNTETSDVATITAEGIVPFTFGNAPIANMYEPLRMLAADGSEAPQRYLDTSPVGWYCEGPGKPIDVRGLTGQYRLKYIRYPRQVTQASDPVDISESGYKPLIMEISSLIKSVKNFYAEAEAMGNVAKSGYAGITQAAISGRGPSSGGQPPSYGDVMKAQGGT